MLKTRTKTDNRQLSPNELQFESIQGAISVELYPPGSNRSASLASPVAVVRVTTVRGIPDRQAQFADLDAEALDAFIAHLQTLQVVLKDI